MRSNPIFGILIFAIIILVIDYYAFTGLKRITTQLNKKIKKLLFYIHWIIPPVVIAGIVLIIYFRQQVNSSEQMIYFHFFSGVFFLFYIPKLVFIVFKFAEDLIRLFARVTTKAISKKVNEDSKLNKISRSQFLSRVGIITAAIPFVSVIYGIGYGRFNFTVRKVPLKFKMLPEAFNGLKIVQISDFHIGSFLNNKNEVTEAINLINDQKPDIILFTGDLVNNVASELDSFIPELKRLQAPFGKYSILGNHDYGEYVRWESETEKNENLKTLLALQQEAGFKMLLNESQEIKIADESITIVGVENWGLPPFPQYGDLTKALSGVPEDSFKILMSHDPTHWSEQVLAKTNIDLTLSGHTHGAQFGIEIPGWRWSPVSLRYKHWGGLYEENNQQLYVNTGLGFIGFPGRVGMPPEITVFTLTRDVV